MSEVSVDGHLHDYAVQVLQAVAEVVGRTTGGNVRLELARDGEEDFGFAIYVNSVEWCICRYTTDHEARLTNHPVMLSAINKALGRDEGDAS